MAAVAGALCCLVVLTQDHNDEVLCLDMHPEHELVVSGQVGRTPKLIVWSSITLDPKRVLTGHTRGISHAKFSPGSGRYIVSAGLDPGHTLLVQDWVTGETLARILSTPAKICDISFTPDAR